jgi:ACS family glucarate transporter-like MFS transporter
VKRPWRIVALLSATATASYLCRVNLSVAGVLMMRDLGLSQQAMVQVFSAFLVGYALCQIPGGMLADRFGAPRVLAWAALGWVAATAAIVGAGTSIAALLAAR